MTLQKAIEILTIHNDHNPNFTDAEREQAHELGLEALKWRLLIEQDYGSWCGPPLPGETEN